MIQCWKESQPCFKCERDRQLLEERQRKQDEYFHRLITIEDKIAEQEQTVKDLEKELDYKTTLKEKEAQLLTATQKAKSKSSAMSKTKTTAAPNEVQVSKAKRPFDTTSEACLAWKHQKTHELADNEHIDAIMGMIGLESVKSQILTIKDRVDTSLRRGDSLLTERFNAILLGNPGTGIVSLHYQRVMLTAGR